MSKISTASPTRAALAFAAGCFGLLAMLLAASPVAAANHDAPAHGIAMHGEPALPADFERFRYADPDAQRGGRVVLALQGTYDSLNPWIVLGVAPDLAPRFVMESLMTRALDEPFSVYGLVARSVSMPDDRSEATFRLDPRARFSDGEPLTSKHVRESIELLRRHGKPFHRSNFAKITAIETPDEHTIRFVFDDSGDRELPLLVSTAPIFATHTIDPETFDRTTLQPMIGSGPYRFGTISPGERVSVVRRDDYWGEDLPVRRDLFNFDEIRYEFFRDANSMFEAFKTGAYDWREEEDPTRWATGYDFPAIRDGRIVREEIPIKRPHGMTGFVFNTRRDVFEDVRVREALGMVFDFEWVNANLLFGLFARAGSYFDGADLSARGVAADADERLLLEPYAEAVRADILEGTWHPPVSDGSGRDRRLIRGAIDLLAEAGWRLDGNVMRSVETGEPLAFEFLAVSRQQERLALNFAQSLQRIGIAMSIRLVDDAQYWRRLASFDFDMIQWTWRVSPSPGNEQVNRWSSVAAEREGSLNYSGAREPGVDAMIASMLGAQDREGFAAAVRALDRLLLSGFYVVPLYNKPDSWIAYDSGLRRPAVEPLLGIPIELWWRESR